MHIRSGHLLLFVLIALLLAAGCTTSQPFTPDQTGALTVTQPGTAWKDIQLTDLGGRGNFSISSFAGRAVIVPVVSISCASCIPQLNRQVAEAATVSIPGTSTEVVVLDMDPADGPDFLTAYGGRSAFPGWSARAPEDMAMQLFRRFGPFVIDTTALPVIIVCPDGRDLLLPPGPKDAAFLNRSIVQGC
ncbi:hypothetical protein [Methanoregula sp.]|uniref:hypothetical protein n=1 Tax=Methanoregula sp. TaxID=2052170 RepID=UPI000CBB239B|nr:hypothetical protein [Methanoregula sp.]PKG31628.1 MAG: hypothetical protein CW742_12405 [Methanoregula sp.]